MTKVVTWNEKTKEHDTTEVEVKPRERVIHLLKHSLCFLTKGSTTKEFTADMAIEVLPKLIITHLVDIVDEKKYISITAIRRLVNFIRLFRLLIELSPEVQKKCNEKLEEFIKDESKRVKDHCSSLGDLLAFITISDKFQMKDLL